MPKSSTRYSSSFAANALREALRVFDIPRRKSKHYFAIEELYEDPCGTWLTVYRRFPVGPPGPGGQCGIFGFVGQRL
eukprot:8000150-Pyramimonas_sp.AAC.1